MDSVSDLLEIVKKFKIFRILGLAILIPFLIIVLVANLGWEATFSVNAESGYIKLLTKTEQKNWMLQNINMYIDSEKSANITGILTIAKDVKVVFQNLFDGRVYISIDHENQLGNQETIASFHNHSTGTVQIINSIIELEFPLSNQNYLYNLPIEGELQIGNVIHNQADISNPVLTSGKIQIFGATFLQNTRFKAMEEELEPGDQMHLENNEERAVEGFGFISIENNQIMKIQYHSEADIAVVARFGSKGYSIGPTIWNRLAKDQILNMIYNFLSTVTPIILFLMLLYLRWGSSVKKIKEEANNKNQ